MTKDLRAGTGCGNLTQELLLLHGAEPHTYGGVQALNPHIWELRGRELLGMVIYSIITSLFYFTLLCSWFPVDPAFALSVLDDG